MCVLDRSYHLKVKTFSYPTCIFLHRLWYKHIAYIIERKECTINYGGKIHAEFTVLS